VTVQVISFIVGAVFILIAIIGGGFTVRDLSFPAVPKSGRIGSGVVGVIFIVYAILMPPRQDSHPVLTTPSPTPSGSSSMPPTSSRPDSMPILHEDGQPHKSNRGDGIEVSKLVVRGEHKPLQLGDLMTVQYTLRNMGDNPVTLEYIFVGSRDPAQNNYKLPNLGEFDANEALQPGEEYYFEKSSTSPPETGVWTFWPCYRIAGAPPLEGYCPDLWQSFPVKVVEGP